MPPQPLLYVHKNPGALHFTPDAFDQFPGLAVAVVKCIAAWSDVELAFGSMFVQMIGENKQAGASLWNGFASSNVKNESFKPLCLSALPESDYYIISCMLKMMKSYQTTRDTLAHWRWGYGSNVKSGLILVDTKHLWAVQGRIGDALTMMKRAKTGKHLDGIFGMPDNALYLYRQSDGDRDLRDFKNTEVIL